MYTFTSKLNKKEYDEFVLNYSMASFMQEYNWANINNKTNITIEITSIIFLAIL